MDYVVIGDSHECVPELRRMTERLEKKIPGVQIIHVGDYLNKGRNTADMVRFMHYRMYTCLDKVLRGNHENFVFGRLSGSLHALEDPAREQELFGSQQVLLGDAELRRMFFGMWDCSEPFFCQDFSVTHAPCREEYIGRHDSVSVKAQRNYRTIDRSIPAVEDLKWFYDQAKEESPLHIFGHMAHSGKTLEECQYKNKIFLDTGCVYGNGLSAVHIRNGKIEGFYFEPSDYNRQPSSELPSPLGLR